MKYAISLKRPNMEDATNEIVKMIHVLEEGGIVHWGNTGMVKCFAEPFHNDGTPAVELGYIKMLVEAPLMIYLRDAIRFRKYANIERGWPETI